MAETEAPPRVEFVSGTPTNYGRSSSWSNFRFSINGTEFFNISTPRAPEGERYSKWREMLNAFQGAINEGKMVTVEITETKSKGRGGWRRGSYYQPPAWRLVTLVIDGQQLWPPE